MRSASQFFLASPTPFLSTIIKAALFSFASSEDFSLGLLGPEGYN